MTIDFLWLLVSAALRAFAMGLIAFRGIVVASRTIFGHSTCDLDTRLNRHVVSIPIGISRPGDPSKSGAKSVGPGPIANYRIRTNTWAYSSRVAGQ